MSHVDLGRRVTLYLNLCCWLVGFSVDRSSNLSAETLPLWTMPARVTPPICAGLFGGMRG
jgi:hypothetical protein